MPKVKVCCIGSPEEADLALRHGADALGLVSRMPGGPGVISEKKIAEIASHVPEEIDTFLLTSLRNPDEIIAQHRRCGTTTLQLVDDLPTDVHPLLRAALPGIRIVQVIHVVDESSFQKAQKIAPGVDGLLLDSGNPALEVKQLGGTGRTHNWAISRQIVRAVGKPVFLAGGLHSDNISKAIKEVRPYGVDVCSGLRTDGTLDPVKMESFFRQIRETVREE